MDLDDDTRDRLHYVLAYLLESEAKDYWFRHQPADREYHVYAKTLALINTFGFEDLKQADAAIRGEPGDPPPWQLIRASDELPAGVSSAEQLVETAGVLAELDHIREPTRQDQRFWLTLSAEAEPVPAGSYVLVCGQLALKIDLLEDAKPDQPAPFQVVGPPRADRDKPA
jgi:hypothetical protein